LIKSSSSSQILHEDITCSVIVHLKFHLNRSNLLPNLVRIDLILESDDGIQDLSLTSSELLDSPNDFLLSFVIFSAVESWFLGLWNFQIGSFRIGRFWSSEVYCACRGWNIECYHGLFGCHFLAVCTGDL
jgi:hypothetical protein